MRLLRRRSRGMRSHRERFWLLPAIGMAIGLVSGFGLVELDYALGIDPGFFTFVDLQSARAVLQTIATVTVSVAGLTFSVTVVALQLASQQLSPRVMRTFQDDRLAQSVLAVFVGTFVYALIVLAKLTERGVPALSVSVAILGAVAAFGLFVAFIHHIIASLKASTIIKRIARDGRVAVRRRWPGEVGDAPLDPRVAEGLVDARMDAASPVDVRTSRAGYVRDIDGTRLLGVARSEDLLVEQRAAIGDFVLTGTVVARLWSRSALDDDVSGHVLSCFGLDDERSVGADVAYPVRQLADVALRALSPSLNDPTTADNALDSMAELLVLFAREPLPAPVRVDRDGIPRLVAIVPRLDDLVRVGFEQVRVSAATQPTVAQHMLRLLDIVGETAHDHGEHSLEIGRQARLLRDAPDGQVPNGEDARDVRHAFERGHFDGS